MTNQSSRVFEGFDYLIDNRSGQALGLAARCTATFSDDYPVKYSDASPAQ
ncbi:hypothetical protein LCGC14_1311990 [marine sediment metagenome]|uniref:Uncharacterized protein n=1 Tax=marine sediment metagenome TaxID=412755 RepID=A0A0F9L733_9ZZZZ